MESPNTFFKNIANHVNWPQGLHSSPSLCSLPPFFHLSPFALRLLTAKYLHSYFGWQYIIPSGNQELSFKRWPLLTSDPGASHPAAPLHFLSPWIWIVKWKNGSKVYSYSHTSPLPFAVLTPKKERKMNETHSSISRRGRRKPYRLKSKQRGWKRRARKEMERSKGAGVGGKLWVHENENSGAEEPYCMFPKSSNL